MAAFTHLYQGAKFAPGMPFSTLIAGLEGERGGEGRRAVPQGQGGPNNPVAQGLIGIAHSLAPHFFAPNIQQGVEEGPASDPAVHDFQQALVETNGDPRRAMLKAFQDHPEHFMNEQSFTTVMALAKNMPGPDNTKQPTEASLALSAAQGDKSAASALKILEEQKKSVTAPTAATLALTAAKGDPLKAIQLLKETNKTNAVQDLVTQAYPNDTPAQHAQHVQQAAQAMLSTKEGNFTLDDTSATMMAEALYKGDFAPMQAALGFSRNRPQLVGQVFGKLKELHPEITGSELADLQAQFSGEKTAANVVGRVSGSVAQGAQELQQMGPLVKSTAAKVDITRFPDVQAVENAVLKHTGDPNIIQLNSYIQTLKNAYVQVMSRGGRLTDQQREQAGDLISGKMPISQIYAAVNAMGTEAGVAQSSAKAAMKDVTTGNNTPVTPPTADNTGDNGPAPKQKFPTPSPASIDILKNNPALRGLFDTRYGPGASDAVLGKSSANTTPPAPQTIPSTGGGAPIQAAVPNVPPATNTSAAPSAPITPPTTSAPAPAANPIAAGLAPGAAAAIPAPGQPAPTPLDPAQVQSIVQQHLMDIQRQYGGGGGGQQ